MRGKLIDGFTHSPPSPLPSREREAGYEVFINGGRTPTGLEAVAWAREVERLGAGEIVLTSMDADGTKNGYDLAILEAVTKAVNIPVVACGGAGSVRLGGHGLDVLADARGVDGGDRS